jgi:imidazoleglycerol phosphate dehydratase HisB
MDEAQASVVLDLSGRSYFKFDGAFKDSMVGGMPVDMVAHIFRSIAENLNATIHVSVNGENTHHMVEACFKAFGRALRQAIAVNGLALPSTKGVL